MPLMIDGHLDVAMNALLYERDQLLSVAELREREKRGVADDRGIATVSLPELHAAGVALIVGTLIMRCKPWVDPSRPLMRIDLDYPAPSMAYAAAQGQLAYYRLLEAQGHLRIITTREALQAHLAQWQTVLPPIPKPRPLGLVLLMEGADPIVSPEQLTHWYDQGLRMLALAHYGHSRYAAGTPSRDPASPEQDGPLTPLGRDLLKRANKLPIALDLSHLADTSFHQALDCFHGPVCASHTNCRALANTPRQFTDSQLKLIIERDGVIGLPMYKGMIRWLADGDPPRSAVQLRHVIEHVDHICQLAGSADHVALGTDLDGGFGVEAAPAGLDVYSDLHKLGPLMAERGFTDDDVARFFHGNWQRFLLHALPSAAAAPAPGDAA